MSPHPQGWWGGCRLHSKHWIAAQSQSRTPHWAPTPVHESMSARKHTGLDTPQHICRHCLCLSALNVSYCLDCDQVICAHCTHSWMLRTVWCPRRSVKPVVNIINYSNGNKEIVKLQFAFSVAICLTRVWLSMTWCSRMMRRAEVLIGEPKDSSPTSDPAYAWEKHHNNILQWDGTRMNMLHTLWY